MLRLILTQFRKLLGMPVFYCSVAAVTVLCMLSPLHRNMSTQQDESVFYCMNNYTQELMLRDTQFNSYNVLKTAGTGWVVMFMPVLASIGPVTVFADERDSREKRNVVARTGHTKYLISNCVFFMIAGALVYFLGCFVFAVIAKTAFPDVSAYQKEMIMWNMMSEFSEDVLVGKAFAEFGTVGAFAVRLAGCFIYGALSVLPAMILSSAIKNKYLIVCIPFFVRYSISNISSSLMSKFMLSGDMKYYKASEVINPEGILNSVSNSEYAKQIYILSAVLVIASVTIFFVVSKLGVDKGD